MASTLVLELMSRCSVLRGCRVTSARSLTSPACYRSASSQRTGAVSWLRIVHACCASSMRSADEHNGCCDCALAG